MFAHGFPVDLKLALSLTVSSQQRKRLFTHSEMRSDPYFQPLHEREAICCFCVGLQQPK
jgi:hypothetical protein